ADALQVLRRDALDGFPINDRALAYQALVGALVVQVGQHFLAAQDGFEALQAFVGQNADLVAEIVFELRHILGLDLLGALVLLLALAAEDPDVDHGAFNAGRAGEGSVAHVAGLLAEDGTQQLLFRSELSFDLGRHLAHQDVAVSDLGADANYAALVQVAQRVLAHIGNVAGNFLGTQLGVAGLDLALLDVNRGVVILLDQPLADEDRVLEVVSAPRHERDQHVSAQRQFALFGAGTISDHLALYHPLAFADHRLLVDAGVLVGALELDELVDVGTDFAGELSGVVLAFHAHDDALGIDRIHE